MAKKAAPKPIKPTPSPAKGKPSMPMPPAKGGKGKKPGCACGK